jgi:flagellar biosynthetic protein FliQ
MTEGVLLELLQRTLYYTLIVALPVLAVSVIVGLAVSIFQTATALQEQTIIFVPKIIAVLIALLIFGGWMLQMLIDYCEYIFSTISKL